MLRGYKTYLAAALVFVAGGLYALNVIDQQTLAAVVAMATGLGFFGLRDAMKK